MAVHSKLLATGGSSSTAGEVVYTVPVGHTSIVKSIRIANGTQASTTFYIGASIGSGLRWFTYSTTLVDYVFSEGSLWLVLPAGYELTFQSVEGTPGYFWISGTELIGEPTIPTTPTTGGLERPSPLPVGPGSGPANP